MSLDANLVRRTNQRRSSSRQSSHVGSLATQNESHTSHLRSSGRLLLPRTCKTAYDFKSHQVMSAVTTVMAVSLLLHNMADQCVLESWIDITASPASTLHILSADSTPVPSDDVRNSDHLQPVRMRRTLRPHLVLDLDAQRRSGECSSQEEYEESESESDKVLTSSNEGLSVTTKPIQAHAISTEHHDEDGTAVNRATNLQCFTPQPNLFSHPPASQARHSEAVAGSYFPATKSSPRSSSSTQSIVAHKARPQQSTSAHQAALPTPQHDHDAALRASLSTLLSCAAAARGLPTPHSQPQSRAQTHSSRIEARCLRVVPESVALADIRRLSPPGRARPCASSSQSRESSLGAHRTDREKSKRKAVARDSSKERRAAKKPRRLGVEDQISPTLLTWFTAAGLVVVVSALSFSTGFVMGRATGRMEASGLNPTGSAGGTIGNCSADAAHEMGIKRLRWSSAASAIA